jgi:two-component system, OmpR family, response regulator
MTAILIAENDPAISSMMRKGLFAQGFSVRVVTDAMSAYSHARSGNFDLMVLATGLPGPNILEVIRRLRARGCSLPVVVLTPRAGVAKTAAWLHDGPDTYIAKPFGFDELLSTVRRRLDPKLSGERTILSYGGLQLDLRTRRAHVGDYAVDLSERECALAETFMRHPGEVLTREQLRKQVWGHDRESSSNIVDQYVLYLRRKLGADRFVAKRGIGYRLAACQH